jgi:hypothetical protein
MGEEEWGMGDGGWGMGDELKKSLWITTYAVMTNKNSSLLRRQEPSGIEVQFKHMKKIGVFLAHGQRLHTQKS